MHIISGLFRHRKIIAPEGKLTRPTSSRLRETVFNICQMEIANTHFLDICAGSGAMGLEALSRGAESATFIDNSLDAAEAISSNIKNFSVTEKSTLITKDALSALIDLEKAGKKFNICYIDPPYKQDELLLSLISFLDKSSLLAADATLFVEDDGNPFINGLVLNQLTLDSKRKSGDSMLYVFRN